MQDNLRKFIEMAKDNLLADAKKPAIEPDISNESLKNTIFKHANYIDLTKIQFEQISIAVNELELARAHVVGALGSLVGFNGIEKSHLLMSANLINSYIYMLNEFVRLKQARAAKPIKGIHELRQAV